MPQTGTTMSMPSRCPTAQEARLPRQEALINLYPTMQVFLESSMPIISFYDTKGRVRKIDADRGPDEVYADVRPLVQALQRVAV